MRREKKKDDVYPYELTHQIPLHLRHLQLNIQSVGRARPLGYWKSRWPEYMESSSSLGENLHMSSFRPSRSHIANPSIAKIFRLGFRPTGSRFATLLTRKARTSNIRGWVVWTNRGWLLGKVIYEGWESINSIVKDSENLPRRSRSQRSSTPHHP